MFSSLFRSNGAFLHALPLLLLGCSAGEPNAVDDRSGAPPPGTTTTTNPTEGDDAGNVRDAGSGGGGGRDAAGDSSTAVDTTKDPKNCGAPGHDCLGGACKASVCQPKQIRTGTKAFAVENGILYRVLANTKELVAGPIDDPSKDALLATLPSVGSHMVLTPNKIVVQCEDLTGTFAVVPKAGGTPTSVFPTAPASWMTPIAATDDLIFWSKTSGPLKSVPTSGGASTDLSLVGVYPIALDGSDLFVVDGYGGNTPEKLYKLPVTGGTPTKLADVPFTGDLAVTSTDVLGENTSASSFACATMDTEIYAVPRGGGAKRTIATLPANNGRFLVTDDSAAYLANYCGWSVHEVVLATGATRVVMPGNPSEEIRGVAMDSKSVYALESSGVLRRVAR